MPTGRLLRLALRVALVAGLLALAPVAASRAADPEVTKEKADALLAEGQALTKQEDFLGARPRLEQALVIYRQIPPSREQMEALLALGGLLEDLAQSSDDRAKVVEYYAQALTIARALQLRREEAQTLGKLASRTEKQAAADLYQQALVIWREVGDEEEQAQAACDVAFAGGSREAQLTTLQELLAVQVKAGLEHHQADTLERLAGMYAETDLTRGQYAGSEGSKQALRYYREALSLYQRVGDESGQAGVLNTMAGLCGPEEEKECSRQALVHYANAAAAARAAGLPNEEARALRDAGVMWDYIALAASKSGRRPEIRPAADEAISHFLQSQAIWRRLGFVAMDMHSSHSLGIASGVADRREEAREHFRRALTLARRLDDRWEVHSVFWGLYFGGYTDAEEQLGYAEQGLEAARGLGESESYWLSFLGDAEVRVPGRYEGGIAHLEQALAGMERDRDVHGEFDVACRIGDAAREHGEYARAHAAYEQALDIGRKEGIALGWPLWGVRELARALGQYDRAAAYGQERIAHERERGSKDTESMAAGMRAEEAVDAGDYEQAALCDEQALAALNPAGPDGGEGTRVHLAHVRMSQNRLPEAHALLQEAGKEAGPADWGRYHLLSGEFAQAVKELAEARSDIGLGLAYEGQQQWKQAEQAYRQAVERIELSRDATREEDRGEFFQANEGAFRRLEPYEGLVRVLHRQGREEEAFYWSEFTRARLLVEAVARSASGPSLGVPEDLRKQEGALAARLADLGRQLKEQPDDSQLSFQLSLAKGEQSLFVDRLRREYPAYWAALHPEPLWPNELGLGPNEVLFAYKVTEPETLLFLVRRGKAPEVFLIELTRRQLEEQVRSYRDGFAGARKTKDLQNLDVALGNKLYETLLAQPLARVRPGERVAVIPDGPLQLLPLEALVVASPQPPVQKNGPHGPYPGGVRYVGETVSLNYWQSGTAMAAARRLRREAGRQGALVIADPVFTLADARARRVRVAALPEADLRVRGELQASLRAAYGEGVFRRLAGAASLVKALRPIYGKRLRVLAGLEAKEAALKREPLDSYRVLVFATHGVLNANTPNLRQPALVLSQVGNATGEDGYLTMSEVMELKLRAEVVALMACQTGAGKLVGGEGVMAMGRAFQYAGARSVLASLWEAEDASTNLLTEAFLKELAGGQDKAEALRRARQRVRAAGYAHPYYWANFVLIGERGVLGAGEGERQADGSH